LPAGKRAFKRVFEVMRAVAWRELGEFILPAAKLGSGSACRWLNAPTG